MITIVGEWSDECNLRDENDVVWLPYVSSLASENHFVQVFYQ